MKRPHSHIPLLILAIVVTLVVGALYAYMFRATSVAVMRAGDARDIVASEQSDQVQAKGLAALVASTAGDRDRLTSFFVSSDSIVSFITALEALGPQSGSALSIAAIDTDTPANAAPGATAHVHAHIDAHGPWSSVMRLLALAQRMEYAVVISHVKLTAGESDPKIGNIWNISFDVQAPVLVPPAISPATS